MCLPTKPPGVLVEYDIHPKHHTNTARATEIPENIHTQPVNQHQIVAQPEHEAVETMTLVQRPLYTSRAAV
jgi:hypothetical protein